MRVRARAARTRGSEGGGVGARAPSGTSPGSDSEDDTAGRMTSALPWLCTLTRKLLITGG